MLARSNLDNGAERGSNPSTPDGTGRLLVGQLAMESSQICTVVVPSSEGSMAIFRGGKMRLGCQPLGVSTAAVSEVDALSADSMSSPSNIRTFTGTRQTLYGFCIDIAYSTSNSVSRITYWARQINMKLRLGHKTNYA